MKRLSACLIAAIVILITSPVLTIDALTDSEGNLPQDVTRILSEKSEDARFDDARFERQEFPGYGRHAEQAIAGQADSFLSLQAGAKRYPDWTILPYRNRTVASWYPRSSVSDIRILQVADMSESKLEMTPAIYQFSLKSTKGTDFNTAARYSF